MQYEIFKTRKEARYASSKMLGWYTKIIKHVDGYVIQCNKNKYLMKDGFVK